MLSADIGAGRWHWRLPRLCGPEAVLTAPQGWQRTETSAWPAPARTHAAAQGEPGCLRPGACRRATGEPEQSAGALWETRLSVLHRPLVTRYGRRSTCRAFLLQFTAESRRPLV